MYMYMICFSSLFVSEQKHNECFPNSSLYMVLYPCLTSAAVLDRRQGVRHLAAVDVRPELLQSVGPDLALRLLVSSLLLVVCLLSLSLTHLLLSLSVL